MASISSSILPVLLSLWIFSIDFLILSCFSYSLASSFWRPGPVEKGLLGLTGRLFLRGESRREIEDPIVLAISSVTEGPFLGRETGAPSRKTRARPFLSTRERPLSSSSSISSMKSLFLSGFFFLTARPSETPEEEEEGSLEEVERRRALVEPLLCSREEVISSCPPSCGLKRAFSPPGPSRDFARSDRNIDRCESDTKPATARAREQQRRRLD